MLRWMCGKTRKDRMKNVNIRNMIGVAPMEDKLRENRVGWFEHIYRRRSNTIIRNDNTRENGRPKLTLDAVIEKDMIGSDLGEHLAP